MSVVGIQGKYQYLVPLLIQVHVYRDRYVRTCQKFQNFMSQLSNLIGKGHTMCTENHVCFVFGRIRGSQYTCTYVRTYVRASQGTYVPTRVHHGTSTMMLCLKLSDWKWVWRYMCTGNHVCFGRINGIQYHGTNGTMVVYVRV